MNFTPEQTSVIQAPLGESIFAHGPAGAGKSTAGAQRLSWLLSNGVAGDAILVLAPQRTLQDPYLRIIHSPGIAAGTDVQPVTVGGLARRVCDVFWPLIAEAAGFAWPDRSPFFLTLESAQYYMARLVRPLLDRGYFDSVTMDRHRLYAQILDSLNKSAAVGFPYTEIGSRLDSAWVGDPGQRRIYADAQDCASRFREFCMQHNLLDFSLQLELFWNYLWPHPLIREYLRTTYRHLIYDNVEEDVPRAHDLIREWIPHFESALLLYDEEAGYRRFLGADVETGWGLRDLCARQAAFSDSLVMSPEVQDLASSLAIAIDPSVPDSRLPGARRNAEAAAAALDRISCRFYPELLDAIADRIEALVQAEGIPPSEVVLVAPYLSDALRFAITSRLQAAGVPWKTHRPSRALRDEPTTRALLTLAAIAHPHWNVCPSAHDAARAFMLSLNMDLVRAQLLAEIVYRPREFSLSSFDQIQGPQQERITYAYGNRYSRLREWLVSYREAPPLQLDHFLRRLFGEVLSQPGYGLHRDLDGARVAGSLVESVHKFRMAMEPALPESQDTAFDLGKEYAAMLDEGVLAAQYLESWRPGSEQAVLIAPAYSFLMMNRPATVQFWLDPGSDGWFQRLDQPLTHTRVLSRGWPVGRPWTYVDEDAANTDGLRRLVLGLLHRCRGKIVLCMSSVGETGFEQRGRLLEAFQSVLHEDRRAR